MRRYEQYSFNLYFYDRRNKLAVFTYTVGFGLYPSFTEGYFFNQPVNVKRLKIIRFVFLFYAAGFATCTSPALLKERDNYLTLFFLITASR